MDAWAHPAGLRGWLAGIQMSLRAQRSYGWLLRHVQGSPLLDLGCGPGGGLRLALADGRSAIGIDPSDLMLRMAARHAGRGRLALLQAPAEQLPLADGSVGAATSVASILTWEDPLAGLHEVRRVLRPGAPFGAACRRHDVQHLLRRAGFEGVHGVRGPGPWRAALAHAPH